VLRELSTGNEREFRVAGSLIAATINFCPDGRSLILAGYEGTSGVVVLRVNTVDGGVERIPVATDPVTPVLCVGAGNDVLYVKASPA
jgi:hypothetical protein